MDHKVETYQGHPQEKVDFAERRTVVVKLLAENRKTFDRYRVTNLDEEESITNEVQFSQLLLDLLGLHIFPKHVDVKAL